MTVAGAALPEHGRDAACKTMVGFAAVTAFLTAPVLAWLNLRAVTVPGFPAAFRPGRWLRILAWSGLAFLVAFGVVFLSSYLGA